MMIPARFAAGLVSFATLLSFAPFAAAGDAQPFRFPAGREGKVSELKYVGGVPVLVAEGTPEEIGEAVGKLAVKPAPRAVGYPRHLLKVNHAELLWGLFVRTGNGMVS